MILSWRRKRTNKKEFAGENLDMGMEEIQIPPHFRCPISLDLMKDPVTLSTGMTYDRSSIESWMEKAGGKNKTCPVTNQVLTTLDQIPNHALRKMIQHWCVDNSSRGVERIPTPRMPVTAYEVTGVCKRMVTATMRGDQSKCMELVAKIKAWGKDSDRNKKCMLENGAGNCLSECFHFFSENNTTTTLFLLEEILSVMTWNFPLDESKLGSAKSLTCLVWFMDQGKDLSSRQNAVLVLRKLLSLDEKHVDAFIEIEGAIKALVNIIREGSLICPTATKASLACVYYIISASTSAVKIKSRFVELGLVSLLLEILVDAEKSLTERALGVLEGLCDCKQGREKACENALTMPLLVKKMLRVSTLATEFSVSIIWKLSRNNNGDGDMDEENRILIEALQVGAFQKLLVMLQVGCGDGIKDKVTELLKLFNLHISKLECVDSSMDLKYMKRDQF